MADFIKIMLPYYDDDDDDDDVADAVDADDNGRNNYRKFFCFTSSSSSSFISDPHPPLLPLTDNKYLHLHLPEINDRLCHGLNLSSWLLAIGPGSKTSSLLIDPLTRSKITLPALPLPLPLPTKQDHCESDENYTEETISNYLLDLEFYIPSLFLAAVPFLHQIRQLIHPPLRLGSYTAGICDWHSLDRETQSGDIRNPVSFSGHWLTLMV